MLRDLTLQTRPGDRIAVLGANGSGKSTLLRLLDGLLFPSRGIVKYCGQFLSEEALAEERVGLQFRRDVALLFQDPDVQLFCPSVWDEVAFGPSQVFTSDEEIQFRVSEALEAFEITHLADRSPHYLSAGEKKRVGLASLFAIKPPVLLLDEPTAGLDPRSQRRLIDILLDRAGADHSLITATHDLYILEEIADKCLVMDKGQIVATGSPGEILADNRLLEEANLVFRQSRAAWGASHAR